MAFDSLAVAGLGSLLAFGILGLSILHSRRDAVALLTVILSVLLLLSARLVVRPLGGVGTPALLLGLVALLWWLSGVLVPSIGLARGRQPARWIVLGYAWYMVMGNVIAHTRALTQLEVSGSDRGLITLAALVGIALIAADGIDSFERLQTLLRRLTWLGAAFALIGLMQFFLGFDVTALTRVPGLSVNRELSGLGTRSSFNRPFSTALHPIEYSVVLCMLLPLAIHFAMHTYRRRGRVTAWLIVGLIAAGIPMSLSRSGIVGLVAAMAMMFAAWNWRQRRYGLIIALAFTSFLYVAVPGLIGSVRSMFLRLDTDPSITARIDRVPRVMELIAERPWFGRGSDTYSVDDYFLLDNQYYVSAVENGLVGVAVIVAFLVGGIALGTSLRRRGADEMQVHMGYALAAPLAVALVTLGTFDALFYRIFTALLFLFVGCAGALWRLSASGPASTGSTRSGQQPHAELVTGPASLMDGGGSFRRPLNSNAWRTGSL